MTNPISNQGTAPLNRTGPLARPKPPEAAKPAEARAKGTGQLADQSTVAAGDLPGVKKLDIEAVSVPDEPKKEEKKGFWGGLWGSVKSVASEAWDTTVKVATTAVEVVVTGAQVVGAAAAETVDSLAEGQGVLDSLSDGVKAGGKKLYDEVIDPTLDKSVLGADNEYQDKGAGALGPILTNRLKIGESVDIRIEAGATIPTELVGAPNIKADAGGTMRIKRVVALDENNQPIINKQTGEPETRLEVELQLDGKVGGAYSASVGFKSTVQAGRYEAGIKAKAEAEAEAGLTGKLTLKLRFNPDSPEEMGNLGAMMKATAATGAAVAVPGIGTVFAAMSHEEYQRSMESLPKHLESFGGEGGLYAQANASAQLGLGIYKRTDLPEGDDKAEKAGAKKESKLATMAKEQLAERAVEAEDGILEKLKLDLGSASIGAGGELTFGMTKNFRTGERTISVAANGRAQGELNVLGAGKGGATEGNRRLDMVLDRNGELKAINVTQKMTKEQFLAFRSTVEDVYGRPLDEGFIAKLTESDTVTVTYTVKPEVLADIKRKAAGGDADALSKAAAAVLSAAITKDRFKLDQGAITATHRSEFALRAGAELSLGAQIGVRGGVVLGHEQETVVK